MHISICLCIISILHVLTRGTSHELVSSSSSFTIVRIIEDEDDNKLSPMLGELKIGIVAPQCEWFSFNTGNVATEGSCLCTLSL